MRGLVERLHAKFVREYGGDVACAKALMGRGSSATTGVEGYYAHDGTQTCHSLLLRPEGPREVVDMFCF